MNKMLFRYGGYGWFLFLLWLWARAMGTVTEVLHGGGMMEVEEIEAVSKVLQGVSEEGSWHEPCSDNSWPVMECEEGPDNLLHVISLRIGASDSDVTACRANATLSPSISRLTFLRNLFIYHCINSSSSSSSSSIFSVSANLSASLQAIVLKGNRGLMDEVPKEVCDLKSLRVLSLSESGLRGKLPLQIREMKSLQHLDLSYNSLTGTIPDVFGGMKNLLILELQGNSFEGSIPPSIACLISLQKLDLTANNLSGKLPTEIESLSDLRFMALGCNRFKGPLPQSLASLKKLEYLILEQNPIDSLLPAFMGELLTLSELSLSSAGLHGPIPTPLCKLTHLRVLSLDNNNLTGHIPPELEQIEGLCHLNLSVNNLSGMLPFSSDFLRRLGRKLQVGGNKDLYIRKEMELPRDHQHGMEPLPADCHSSGSLPKPKMYNCCLVLVFNTLGLFMGLDGLGMFGHATTYKVM